MKLTRFENMWNGLGCNLKPFSQYLKTKNYYISALINTLQQLSEIPLDVGLGCNDGFRCLYLSTITNQNLIMHLCPHTKKYFMVFINNNWYNKLILHDETIIYINSVSLCVCDGGFGGWGKGEAGEAADYFFS
jgi:hypothetical protein